MKHLHAQIFYLILFSICLSAVNVSAEENFFSKLNPFRKKDSPPVRVRISDTPESSFMFPQWKKMKMPWSGPSFKFTPTWVSNSWKPPSLSVTWNRMSRGTRDFYNKSKAILMPWTEPDMRQPPVIQPTAGSRGIYRAIPKKAKPEKKNSFFSSFFSSKKPEPTRPVRTVGEFLSQDRPKP